MNWQQLDRWLGTQRRLFVKVELLVHGLCVVLVLDPFFQPRCYLKKRDQCFFFFNVEHRKGPICGRYIKAIFSCI